MKHEVKPMENQPYIVPTDDRYDNMYFLSIRCLLSIDVVTSSLIARYVRLCCTFLEEALTG